MQFFEKKAQFFFKLLNFRLIIFSTEAQRTLRNTEFNEKNHNFSVNLCVLCVSVLKKNTTTNKFSYFRTLFC